MTPNSAIPSIQVKDEPDATHAVLRRRAAAANQSLQEYLRSWLIEQASRPTLDEVLERAVGVQAVPRVWELRANLGAYDAAYVALAELLDAPLYTADLHLSHATAVRCSFEVLTEPTSG